MTEVTGSCLCGSITFRCDNIFDEFDLCHCHQCQKITGSAFIPNLFTRPDNIRWDSGEPLVKRYDVPGRAITSAFCGNCGSPVPYVSVSGRALIVPAGCLDGAPDIRPQAAIFWDEHPQWYDGIPGIPRHARFPEK